MVDWAHSGRTLARRLLASGASPFQLADLRFRFGVLVAHHGRDLAALGARPGEEGRTQGVWATHLDGTHLFLTNARIAAENAWNRGWEEVVDGALRDRTRDQRLPGEGAPGDDAGDAGVTFLVTLGLPRDCTAADVKRAYRDRAMAAHPDQGGDHDLFVTLGRARDQALAYVAARDKRR